MAGFVDRPERFLNAHWLNPAFLIPLVELSVGSKTAPDTVARLKTMLEGVGKVPVVLKASPGFVVPRIQSLAMSEAARAAEEGIASPEEIDKAIRVGFGLRFAILGLIEFIDWGGNDILYYAAAYQRETLRKLVDLLDHLGLMAPPGGVTDPADSPAAKAGNPFLRSGAL